MSEMSITSVVHRGVRYSIGDRYQSCVDKINDTMDLGIVHLRTPITVAILFIEDGHIGVKSDSHVDGWHSLDGRVEHGFGYYVRAEHLAKYFRRISSEGYQVSEDVVFKNRNLKGMACSILKPYAGGEMYFVELSENVGAGGADGLGKAGHCVLLSANKIKRKKLKEESS